MPWYVNLPIVFLYTALLWAAVLFLYNLLFEPFDYGPLDKLAPKAFILILLITFIVGFAPVMGGMASLIVWWIGSMIVFKKSFLECKWLVLFIWGTTFLFGLAILTIQLIFFSEIKSPVSTV